jgi:hypothetical protein
MSTKTSGAELIWHKNEILRGFNFQIDCKLGRCRIIETMHVFFYMQLSSKHPDKFMHTIKGFLLHSNEIFIHYGLM